MLQVGGMNDLLVPHPALIFITSLKLVDAPSFDPISLAKTNVAGMSDLVARVGDKPGKYISLLDTRGSLLVWMIVFVVLFQRGLIQDPAF